MKNTIKKNIVENDTQKSAKIPEWKLFVNNKINDVNEIHEYDGLNASYKITCHFIFEI